MIKFYRTRDEWGEFSNFYPSPFVCPKGKRWPTAEHYFQAQKFLPHNPEYAERIRLCKSPMVAARMGRSRKHQIRQWWDLHRDGFMREALILKFTQNKELADILLSTGNMHIVEDSPKDSYWGCGRDGSGLNKLGNLLMDLREAIRVEKEIGAK